MQAKKTTKAPKKKASKKPKKTAAKKSTKRKAAKKGTPDNVVEMRPSEQAKAQQLIPGTERLCDMEIEDLADQLYDVRSKRMELTKQETAAGAALLAAMQDRGLDSYISEELKLRVEVVSAAEKVKIKRYEIEVTSD